MKKIFDDTSYDCSTLVTKAYSTSFSWGIRLLSPRIRSAIYAIYGFVRYADEIVDTFHGYDQEVLLKEFKKDYYKAVERRISLNPILNAFQENVIAYELHDYVEQFLQSMECDLDKTEYRSRTEYQDYIYGSADVVGLMCLRVFVNNDERKFQELKGYAMRLGSAFQKVNFLRDLKEDEQELGRSYFPNIEMGQLTKESKQEIIKDIEDDFKEAYKGVVLLPIESRLGVYLAYKYYLNLLLKLKRIDYKQIMNGRVRISNPRKVWLFGQTYVRHKLNLV